MEVSTDGDQHQDIANVTTEIWVRGGRRRVCEDEGLETAWLRPALEWFTAQYDFMVVVLKSAGEA